MTASGSSTQSRKEGGRPHWHMQSGLVKEKWATI